MLNSAFPSRAGLSIAAVVASLLALPSHGASAAETDPSITKAAQVNHLSPTQVRAKLRGDHTVHVGSSGRFYYVDQAAPAAVGSGTSAAAEPVAPLEQTFLLHSKPGSKHTIFLDFDGANVSGTGWNSDPQTHLPARTYAGWSLDANPAFTDQEKTDIQEVWTRVAEDYAAFDVNVTTADPGAAALERTSDSDDVYGVRVLFAGDKLGDTTAWANLCSKACGGLAYFETFDEVGSAVHQPAWVFPGGIGPDAPSAMADAAAHEAGHTFGLSHDGLNGAAYFSRDGLWGPIMGAPYVNGVSQWSDGSYPGSDNLEDDIAIIRGVVGSRADEAPSDISGAPALGAGQGYIDSAADADTYALGDCTGSVTVAAVPVASGADLDIKLELLDAAGGVVASAAPATTGPVDWGIAAGLDATLTKDLAAGADFVRISGTGAGSQDWATPDDYDSYASIGEYQLTRSGGSCSTVAGTLPSAPTSVTAAVDPTSPQTAVTVSWAPPSNQGSSSVTGYEVSVSGGATATKASTARTHTFTGLLPGTTYTFTVKAKTGVGTGPGASAEATTDGTTVPSAPTDLTATALPSSPKIDLSWGSPDDEGSSAVIGYRLLVNGKPLQDENVLTSEFGGLEFTGAYGTTYTFVLRAVNDAGEGAPATKTATTVKGATTVTLTVPSKVKKGKRPVVKVVVKAGATAASGKVKLTVGKKTVTLTLSRGVATYKAAAQKKVGTVKVAASYLGSTAFKVSSKSKTFKVVR